MARRPPAKVRGKRQVIVHRHEKASDETTAEPVTYAAPSHIAGHFEQHDHGSGHGAFGFTEHTLP